MTTEKNADRAAVKHLKKVLHRFAQFDPKMQLSTVLTLLEIIEADTMEVVLCTTDVEERVGMKPGTASRNIYYWADGHKHMSGSFGLVNIALNIEDRRRRDLTLTTKGKVFARNLIEDIKEYKNG